MLLDVRKNDVYPNMNAQSHGMSRRRRAATALAATSKRQGMRATLKTVSESFLRATGSRPIPALSRITVSAIFLSSSKSSR